MACEFLEICPAAIGKCVRAEADPGPDCAGRLICAYLETHPKKQNIFYLCDQRQCEDCSALCDECFHTSDINHAKNFREFPDKFYFEDQGYDLLPETIKKEIPVRLTEYFRPFPTGLDAPRWLIEGRNPGIGEL